MRMPLEQACGDVTEFLHNNIYSLRSVPGQLKKATEMERPGGCISLLGERKDKWKGVPLWPCCDEEVGLSILRHRGIVRLSECVR